MLHTYLTKLAEEETTKQKVAGLQEQFSDLSTEDLLKLAGLDKLSLAPVDLQLPDPPPSLPPGTPPLPEPPPEMDMGMGGEMPPEMGMGEEMPPEMGGSPAETAAEDATMPLTPDAPATPSQVGSMIGAGVGTLLGMLGGIAAGAAGRAPMGLGAGAAGALGAMAGAGAGALGGGAAGGALGGIQQGMNQAFPPSPPMPPPSPGPVQMPATSPAMGGMGMPVNPPGMGGLGPVKMSAMEIHPELARRLAGAGVGGLRGAGYGAMAGSGAGGLVAPEDESIMAQLRGAGTGATMGGLGGAAMGAMDPSSMMLPRVIGMLAGMGHAGAKEKARHAPEEETPSIKTGSAIPLETYARVLDKMEKAAAACDTPGEKKRSGGEGRGLARGGGEGPLGVPIGKKVKASDLEPEKTSAPPWALPAGLAAAGTAAGVGGTLGMQRVVREHKEKQIEDALKDLQEPLGGFYRGNPERRDDVADFMSRMPAPKKTPLGTSASIQFAPVSDPMMEYVDELKKSSSVPERFASVLEKGAMVVGGVPERFAKVLGPFE